MRFLIITLKAVKQISAKHKPKFPRDFWKIFFNLESLDLNQANAKVFNSFCEITRLFAALDSVFSRTLCINKIFFTNN